MIVQLKRGVSEEQVSRTAVRQHCAKKFAKFQLPDDVLYWEEIPLTASGKMSKKDVRAKLDQMGYKLPDQRTSKL